MLTDSNEVTHGGMSAVKKENDVRSSAEGRVLVVGNGPPEHGGIPTFIESLLRHGGQHGWDMRFLNLASAGPRQGGRLTPYNILRTARDVAHVYRAAPHVDAVHVHSAAAPAPTLLRAGALCAAARVRRTPVLLHLHGGLLPRWARTRSRRWMVAAALRSPHRVLAVSTGTCHSATEAVGRRAALVDNGVEVGEFRPSRAIPTEETGARRQPGQRMGPPRILYVGQLTPRKGVLDLVAASELLRHEGIDHELWLVGGTPNEGPQEEASVRRSLPSSIYAPGALPGEQLPTVYREADIFCLPSWWEAMPLSVLEAMASGLPVVATDVGDVARAVEEGQTGLLVPPRSPVALAEALGQLLSDTSQRVSMGAAGRRRAVEMFSMDATWAAVEAMYRDVLGIRR